MYTLSTRENILTGNSDLRHLSRFGVAHELQLMSIEVVIFYIKIIHFWGKMELNKHSLLRKLVILWVAIAVAFSSTFSLAAIPYRNYYEEMTAIDRYSRELNLNLFVRMQVVIESQQLDMGKYIPYNRLSENETWDRVAAKIAKHSLQNFLDSEENQRNIPLVSSAQKVDSKISAELQTDKHKFRFRVKPAQTTASLTYSGLFEAALSYDVVDSETRFEMAKAIGKKTLSLSHSKTVDETRDMLAIAWSF